MKGKKTDEDEQRDKAHTCTQLSIDSTNSFPQAVFPIISQLNQNKLNKKQAVCLSVHLSALAFVSWQAGKTIDMETGQETLGVW